MKHSHANLCTTIVYLPAVQPQSVVYPHTSPLPHLPLRLSHGGQGERDLYAFPHALWTPCMCVYGRVRHSENKNNTTQHNTFLKKNKAGFDITHSVFGNRLVYRYTQALFLGVFFPPQKNDETRGFTTEILRKLGWLRFTSMQVFQQVNSLHKKRVSALRESLCTDDR